MSLVHEKQFPCHNLHIPPLGTNIISCHFSCLISSLIGILAENVILQHVKRASYVRGNFKFGLVFSNNPAILTWFI